MNTKKQSKILKFIKSRWGLFCSVLILSGLFFYFHILLRNGLKDSAALYVGLPTILALGVSLMPNQSKSLLRRTMQLLTIALLLSAPILQEGFICILMSSPLLYAAAASIANQIERDRKIRKKLKKLQTPIIVSIIALLSLEGTHPNLTLDRYNVIERNQIIAAPVEYIRQKLSEKPSFDKERSAFLKIFPLPSSAEGNGLNIGDIRKLHFTYNKWFFFNAHEGDTIFKITESSNRYIKFKVIEDTSYLSNYLTWHESEIHLHPIDNNNTLVTWKLSFSRNLDPSWYFGPMQNYAVGLTADTLIENLANPNTL